MNDLCNLESEKELYIKQLEDELFRVKNSNKSLRNNNKSLLIGLNKLRSQVLRFKKEYKNMKLERDFEKYQDGVYTLFVLDFDGTYDNETPDSYGVEPAVYLIPLNRQIEVEQAARETSDEFNMTDYCECIGDLFEKRLREKEIRFQYVGNILLTFGERMSNYLVDYIPKQVV